MSFLSTLFNNQERWPVRILLFLGCVALGLAFGVFVAALTPLKAAAVVGGLVGGLLLLTSVWWGLTALVGVICLLPFAAIPVRIGFYPTFLDAILVVLFMVWGFRLMTQPGERFLRSPLDAPVLLFLGLAVVSFVLGTGYALTATILRRFADVLLAIALYFVVVNVVRTKEHLRGLTILLILGGFGAAAIGVVLYFLPTHITVQLLGYLRVFNYFPEGSVVLRYIEDNPTLPLRATGTANDPNVLGGMLLLTTAIATSQLFSPRPVLARRYVAPMLAVMGLCMLLTFSRGSWIGLAAAVLLIGTAIDRRLWLVFLGGAAVLLLLPQMQTFIAHLVSGLLVQDQAAAMRLGEYKDAVRLISRYPFFGVGFGAAPTSDLYIGVSNVYMLIAEEMGLIGLGSFLLAMAVFCWESFRAWQRALDPQVRGILVGGAGAIAGGLAAGFLDHYFFNIDFPHAIALFWLVVGLTMAAVRLSAGEQGNSEERGA